MSPELKQAVQERVALGYSKEQIVQELQDAGYDDHTIDALYLGATTQLEPIDATNSGMPATITLLEEAFAQTVRRPDFILLLALPTLFFSSTQYIFPLLESFTPAAPLLMLTLFVGMFVLLYLLQLALVYCAVIYTKSGTRPRFVECFVWAIHNFWPWLWVILLTILVVWGGMLLLIIPGLIAAGYIGFAQYAFVDEGVRGIEALQRSRQLVYGRWWTVFRKITLLILFIVIILIFGALFITISNALLPAGAAFVETILNALFSGFFLTLVTFGFVRLYSALQKTQKETPSPTDLYVPFALLGMTIVLFIIGILIISLLEVLGNLELLESNNSDSSPARLEPEMSPEQAEAQAELEALRQRVREELNLN